MSTSAVCVEMTTASTRNGRPSRYSIEPAICRQAAGRESCRRGEPRESLRVRLCAIWIGIGISSGVSLQANPNIKP